jgi:7-carboxy-7-deazaguanine synthase
MKVIERLLTICGETQWLGVPCALIRFAGCHLRCHYCDTAYAHQGGEDFERESLSRWALETGLDLVLLTGGEPLLQTELPELCAELTAAGRHVLVETSGACDISPLRPPVMRSVDVKCPGSGEAERNVWSNLSQLRAGDAVKLVLCDRADYDFAREVIRRYRLGPPVEVLLSAAHPRLAVEELARWMVGDRLTGVRLNIQAHRLLWPALEPPAGATPHIARRR